MSQYVIWTNRYNDGKYIPLLERVFHGISPIFVREDGQYTIYEMPEARTTDQKWAVGSTLESMIASGKISAEEQEQCVAATDAQPAETGPVLAAITPFGASFQAKALLPGSDEWEYFPMFPTEQEACEAITARHPDHNLISWIDLHIEYRKRDGLSGMSFHDRARIWR